MTASCPDPTASRRPRRASRGQGRVAAPPRARRSRRRTAVRRGQPADAAKGPRSAPRRLAGPRHRRRPAGPPRLRRRRSGARFRRGGRGPRGAIGVEIGYDEQLSHLIIAGADIMLVPSRFEPCGLTQLYALRYGDAAAGAPGRRPRRYRGRRDGGQPGGRQRRPASRLTARASRGSKRRSAAPPAVSRARIWRRMMQQAMTRDFSWTAAARRLCRGLSRAAAGPGPSSWRSGMTGPVGA